RPWLRPSLFGVPLVPARSDAFAMLTPSSWAVRLSTVPVIGRVLSFWKERIAARVESSTTPSIFPGSYPLAFKASSTFLISSSTIRRCPVAFPEYSCFHRALLKSYPADDVRPQLPATRPDPPTTLLYLQ